MLADGTVFRGQGFGAKGTAIGEVVFNTGMSGYQEVITDPSYTGQLISLPIPSSAIPALTKKTWKSIPPR